MAEDLEGFDELLALAAAAPDVEAEHRARPAWQELLRQRMAGVAIQHGVAHTADQRVSRQKLDHFGGVFHVAGHAQGQGFDALQNQPGGVRAHASAKVAQAFAPGAQQKGTHGALFAEDHVVKAFISLAQFGELARFVPVKAAAIDHHTAHHRAVTRQKFGGRVINQIGSVV